MKRSFAAVLGLVFVLVGLVAPPASAHSPYCGIRWGSLEKVVSVGSTGPVVNIRSGQHACFDRIVFDVRGKPSWLLVHYVKDVFTVGEGKLVPLRGGAKLEIILSVPSYDDAGRSTYNPANHNELTHVRGYRTFRQVVDTGSFEGQTIIGFGVRARLPFRVFTLTGPGDTGRIVVDVAHTW
jgi:hypothetical protein